MLTPEQLARLRAMIEDRYEALSQEIHRDLRDGRSRELRAHLSNERFRYTHRWTVGDIVYWDNQAVLHARSAFEPTSRRVLKRISLSGSRPF